LQRDRIRGWNLEQLLESEVRDVAIATGLDQRGALVVPRNLRAQEIELGHVADLFPELRLLQDTLRLLQRRFCNGHETIGERSVVVRLRDVELGLCPLRFDLDGRRALLRRRGAVQAGNASAAEHVPPGVQAERPLVARAEAGAREVDASAGRTRHRCV